MAVDEDINVGEQWRGFHTQQSNERKIDDDDIATTAMMMMPTNDDVGYDNKG